MNEEELRAEIDRLKEQLQFAQQKASLYYITKSELDSLRRSAQKSDNENIVVYESVGTDTGDLLTSSQNKPLESACQTDDDHVANILVSQMEKNLLESEIASLKALSSMSERTERLRIQFMQRMEVVLSNETVTSPVVDSVVRGYADLFEEYLRLNSISISHSVEIKKRDEMVGSLLEKIKMMELNFSRRISQAEKLAGSRKSVIEELGEQVKIAMRSHDRSGIGNGEMESEIEDLRAELSMARSNWAATRDELFRLQFRVGMDGYGGSRSEQEYPPPLIALIDSQERHECILSMLREIRDLSSRI